MIYGYIKNVPAGGGGGESLNYNVLKTGATTGVDSTINMGYGVNINTLDADNYFGNLNRFTDRLGGQAYSDGIMVDWSTWRESTGSVLMYNRNLITSASGLFNAVTNIRALTSGGFNDWEPANIKQLLNVFNAGGSAYTTRWVSAVGTLWNGGSITSCTNITDSTDYYLGIHSNDSGAVFNFVNSTEAISVRMLAVRMGNVSEL